LVQQPLGGVYTDQHAAGTQALQDTATESTRTATELNHPVVRPQSQFVQQSFGGLREVRVLDLQPPCGRFGLPKNIVPSVITFHVLPFPNEPESY
jgi:hypothetical protein